MELIINFLVTALLYLPLPLIIRFVFKKKFNKVWAFIISAICFFGIKIVLGIITEQPFNNSAYLYFAISYFILIDTTMSEEQKIKFEDKYMKKE